MPRAPRRRNREEVPAAHATLTPGDALQAAVREADANPALNAMQSVVSNLLAQGEIRSKTKDDVIKLVTNQTERANLFSALESALDFERLVRFKKMQTILESYMERCFAKTIDPSSGSADTPALNPAEAMKYLQWAAQQSEAVASRIRVAGSSINDVLGQLNKIDTVMQEKEKELMNQFGGSTAPGREIIRKVAYRLGKLGKSAPTKSEVDD